MYFFRLEDKFYNFSKLNRIVILFKHVYLRIKKNNPWKSQLHRNLNPYVPTTSIRCGVNEKVKRRNWHGPSLDYQETIHGGESRDWGWKEVEKKSIIGSKVGRSGPFNEIIVGDDWVGKSVSTYKHSMFPLFSSNGLKQCPLGYEHLLSSSDGIMR